MSKDVDETIKQIETDLEDPEQSLPKSAPTQHGIDIPPSERFPLYLFRADCAKCDFKIRREFSDIVAYAIYARAAINHCERNRHKVEYALILLNDGHATHGEFVPSKPTWVRWLKKFRFVLIACVVSVIFACFEGWHMLPLRFPAAVFGAWIGERLCKKWKDRNYKGVHEQTQQER